MVVFTDQGVRKVVFRDQVKFLGAIGHMEYDSGIRHILLLPRSDGAPTMPEVIEASMRRLF